MCSLNSLVIERTTHNSSATLPRFGKSSEMGMPDCPCWLNFQGEASVLPLLLNCVGAIAIGKGLPW